jgi:hypothetical protein
MINDIKKYLLESAKSGYASGDTKSWNKESDYSTTITNHIGNYKMNDNFFGGEPYGGREVIFNKDKPIWLMVYYGRVLTDNPDKIYEILRKVLSSPEPDMPIRGPKQMNDEHYNYSLSWQGTLENFSAEESILQNGELVYKANFIGGVVDKRKGD